ncbi:hypothetical protein KKB06_00595 [Patescibacteria group bacterium]|nr:hypothetical protein [Patescibacteria group bacterium]
MQVELIKDKDSGLDIKKGLLLDYLTEGKNDFVSLFEARYLALEAGYTDLALLMNRMGCLKLHGDTQFYITPRTMISVENKYGLPEGSYDEVSVALHVVNNHQPDLPEDQDMLQGILLKKINDFSVLKEKLEKDGMLWTSFGHYEIKPDGSVFFLLNPAGSVENEFGWYTLAGLKAWLNEKSGPITQSLYGPTGTAYDNKLEGTYQKPQQDLTIDHRDIGNQIVKKAKKSDTALQSVLFEFFDDNPRMNYLDRLGIAENTHTRNSLEYSFKTMIDYIIEGKTEHIPYKGYKFFDAIMGRLLPYITIVKDLVGDSFFSDIESSYRPDRYLRIGSILESYDEYLRRLGWSR